MFLFLAYIITIVFPVWQMDFVLAKDYLPKTAWK